MIKFILAGLLASTAFVSTVNADFKEIGKFGTLANNPSAEETSAEIIAATADGMNLVYSDSPAIALGMIDITDPANPKPLGHMHLGGCLLYTSDAADE